LTEKANKEAEKQARKDLDLKKKQTKQQGTYEKWLKEQEPKE